MIAVAIFYLTIGYTDYLVKKFNGRRNTISIGIYKTMRRIGWILLIASLCNILYDSIYWNLAYLLIAFFGIYLIRTANKFHDLNMKVKNELL